MCAITSSFTTPPGVRIWKHRATQVRASPRRRPRASACATFSKPVTRFVDTPDGARLCVNVFSPTGGTTTSHRNGDSNDAEEGSVLKGTVLLVHDFMTDRRLFDRLLNVEQLIETESTILAPDLRGFGRSSLPTDLYSRSDDLATIVRTLVSHDARVDVVGSGMGGAVALELALAWPTIVRSVCVAGSGLPGHTWTTDKLFVDVTAAQLAGRFFRIIDAEAGDDEKQRADMMSAIFAAVSREDVDPVTWKRQFIATNSTWSDIVRKGKKAIARDLLAMARDYSGFHFFHADPVVPRPYDSVPLISRLKNVSCPVLILIGDRETVDFTKIASEIYQLVPKPAREVIDIEDCGHFAVAEQPGVVVRHLLQFWQSLNCRKSERTDDINKPHVVTQSKALQTN